MNRIVVTRIERNQNSYIAYIELNEKREFTELQVFEPEDHTILGCIYVGYVEKIVPNIHAAFLRIANGQKCYLPLDDIKSPIYAKKQSASKPLCEGDEILVQVVRDAVKTKDAVVCTKLTIHGTYCFLTTDNTHIGVSKKIAPEQAAELSAFAQETCKDHESKGYGLVLRTNAAGQTKDLLRADIEEVKSAYEGILVTGVHQCQGELVYRNMPGYLERLKGQLHEASADIIYTDQPDLYEEIALRLPVLKERGTLQLYHDKSVGLATLYNIRGSIDNLLSSKVWLASGANIIIESLETLTVIDVNSGKNTSRREETLFSINLEAAREIARQLRLRNISGMIIIDFINMKTEAQQKELIGCLKQELKKDHVPASFIDITRLGLVEITRKKVYKSLREVVRGCGYN